MSLLCNSSHTSSQFKIYPYDVSKLSKLTFWILDFLDFDNLKQVDIGK